jgi:DNA-directed RNA polymerase subunit RPC12/RpoP
MKKVKVDINGATANYRCDYCESKEEDVPIQESIYNGPPICLNCGEEMAIDEVYVKI